MNGLAQAALAYAARFRWAVLPTGGATGKVPHTDHGVKDATTDPVVIRRWWEQWPQANVGLACGAASGFWAFGRGRRGRRRRPDRSGTSVRYAAQDRPPTHPGRRPAHPVSLRPDSPAPQPRAFRCPDWTFEADAGFIVAAPSRAPGKARPWAWDVDAHPTETPLACAPAWLAGSGCGATGGRSAMTARRPDRSGCRPLLARCPKGTGTTSPRG